MVIMQTFTYSYGDTPVIFSTPHAGIRRFHDIDSPIIDRQCSTLADIHVDVITDAIEDMIPGTAFDIRSLMTRMECDIERYPDEREEMNAVGMGVIYTNGINGERLYDYDIPDAVSYHRRHALYYPYHERLTEFARHIISRASECLLVDMHSYSTEPLTYELHQNDRRPMICIGVNDETMAEKALLAAKESPYDIGVNETFKGAIVPNDLNEYEQARTSSIMMEIRKDMYLDDNDAIDPVKINGISNEIFRILSSFS
jgi:N-formylglutamate amidohydrolase